MENLDKAIKKELKKWRIRIFKKDLLENLIKFSCLGLIAVILIVILSKFIPIYSPYIKGLWIILLSTIISIIYSFINYPKYETVALKADSFGLKERVITSLELRENKNKFSNIQRLDTLEELKKRSYKSIKLNPQKKYLRLLLVLIFILFSTLLLPNNKYYIAKEIHDVKMAKKQGVKKVEKLKRSVENNSKLKKDDKKTIEYSLERLQENIKKANNKEEIDKTIQKTYKKMQLLKHQYNSKDLDKVANTLIKNKNTKAIGKAIKKRDEEEMKRSINEFLTNFNNMPKDDKKKLVSDCKNLAEEIKENVQLSKELVKLAETMENGNLEKLSFAMNNFKKDMLSLMGNKDFEKTVKDFKMAFDETLSDNKEKEAQSIENQSSANGEEGNDGNRKEAKNAGKGTGDKANNGITDNGSSEEKKTEDDMKNDNAGIGKKTGNSERNLKEYEKIFAPTNLKGEGKVSNIKGKRNKKGSSEEMKTSKGVTIKGESIPYSETLGEYKEKAQKSLTTSTIPEGMKEIIKEYFSSLE